MAECVTQASLRNGSAAWGHLGGLGLPRSYQLEGGCTHTAPASQHYQLPLRCCCTDLKLDRELCSAKAARRGGAMLAAAAAVEGGAAEGGGGRWRRCSACGVLIVLLLRPAAIGAAAWRARYALAGAGARSERCREVPTAVCSALTPLAATVRIDQSNVAKMTPCRGRRTQFCSCVGPTPPAGLGSCCKALPCLPLL